MEVLTKAEYIADYRRKNPDTWYKKEVCEICGGVYLRNSKTNHINTKKHKIKSLEKELEELKKNIKI